MRRVFPLFISRQPAHLSASAAGVTRATAMPRPALGSVRRSMGQAIAVLTTLACTFGAVSAATPPTGPMPTTRHATDDGFAALASAPANATAWIRIVNGTSLMASPEARALVSSFTRVLLDDAAGERWTKFATRLGWSESEAFEHLFGGDARIAIRTGHGPRPDWAILTKVDDAHMGRLVRSLRLTIGAQERFELPEESLRFGYRDGWLVVGPLAEPSIAPDGSVVAATPTCLFDDLADRGALPLVPAQGALTLERELRDRGIVELPPGRISSAFRIGAPIDAACVIGADIVDGDLKASIRGAFRQPPFPGLSLTTLDVSVLARFASTALVASVDPIQKEVSPDDAAIVALVPELIPHGTFRANLGGRRLIIIGDLDGSTRARKSAMRVPEVAIAYEVDDVEQARDDQDAYVAKAYAAIAERFAKPAGIELGTPSIPEVGPRTAPLGPALAAVTGDHPIMRSWCLSWQVVEESRECGGKTAWQVYATDPDWLRTVSETLARGEAAQPVATASAGCASGERIAAHLRSWNGEAMAFVGAKTVSDEVRDFQAGIELLASIAERFGSMHWTVSISDETRIGVDLTATLRPPASAETGKDTLVAPPQE